MENKLNFTQTLLDGVKCGVANALPLLLAGILYIITFWIPYLNVATTIGMYKLIVALSKGEKVDPMSIFDKENFRNLSDFFLLLGLMTAGIGAACAFMFVPGIVLGIAWAYAVYFLIDKNMSPLKALRLSFDVTRGEKWTIFFVEFVLVIAIGIIAGLLGAIPKAGGVLAVIVAILAIPAAIGVEAQLFKHFSAKAEELLAE
ncbi:MAG: hypothetical protein IJV32_03125 [Bacteroidales bacterium]|jgi:uncharacterized membrane protein|nr:hypothetical protein [Bacteroidales bacterium]MBQ9653198.1 hypothetical protein [Bacteroidales bacterium]